MDKVWILGAYGGEYDSCWETPLRAYRTKKAAEKAEKALEKEIKWAVKNLDDFKKKVRDLANNFRLQSGMTPDEIVANSSAYNNALEKFYEDFCKDHIVVYPVPRDLMAYCTDINILVYELPFEDE